jgi:hypothetical protein
MLFYSLIMLEQTIHGIPFVCHFSIFSILRSLPLPLPSIRFTYTLVDYGYTPQTFYHSPSVELRRVSSLYVPIVFVLTITCSCVLYR